MKRGLIISLVIFGGLFYAFVGAGFIADRIPQREVPQNVDLGPATCEELTPADRKIACSDKECAEYAENLKKKYDDLARGILGRDASAIPETPGREDLKNGQDCQGK